MRNKRRCALVLLLLTLVAVLLPACNQDRGSVLHVGVKDDVTNFGLYDAESGRYSGMEIDLAQLLCDALGYSSLELRTVTAVTREEEIDNGTLDMVIATYSITPERQERYDFSAPYYTDRASIMVEKSSMIGKLDDLRGCSIGVMKNSISALSLALYMAERGTIPEFDVENFSTESFDGGITFVEFENYIDISNALEYGDVDAFVADRSILSGYKGDEREILPNVFSEQSYGVCTRKDSALSAQVDATIQQWLEDGTIQGLIEKWGI